MYKQSIQTEMCFVDKYKEVKRSVEHAIASREWHIKEHLQTQVQQLNSEFNTKQIQHAFCDVFHQHRAVCIADKISSCSGRCAVINSSYLKHASSVILFLFVCFLVFLRTTVLVFQTVR